jgi:hypothetical protein
MDKEQSVGFFNSIGMKLDIVPAESMHAIGPGGDGRDEKRFR